MPLNLGTTQFPLGTSSRLRIAQQSTLTAAASSGFFDMNYQSAPFTKTRPLEDDPILGPNVNNAIDDRAPGPGLIGVSGSIGATLELQQIGLLLQAAFGTDTKGGSNPNYTHAFSSGQRQLPVFTLEMMRDTGLYDQVIGAYLKTLEFNIRAGDRGWSKVQSTWGGVDVVESQASSIAGTPTSLALADQLPAWAGSVSIGGTGVGALMDSKLTVTNSFDEDRYAGSAALGAVALKQQSAMLEATVRYTTDTLRAQGVVGSGNYLPTAAAVVLSWSNGANKSLTITAANARFEPISAPIENDGSIQLKLKARFEQSSSAAMLAIALANQTATYFG